MTFDIAYVVGYYPKTATIDIRTLDGITYDNIPFVPSLALYATPIVAKINESGGLEKEGSLAIYCHVASNQIYVVSIFNDDQSLVNKKSAMSLQVGGTYVQNALYHMVQQGELLLSSPGKIIEIVNGTYERVAGGWALFKNSGDVYISNADTSAQFLLDNLGKARLSSVEYTLEGANSIIQEAADGSLTLGTDISKLIFTNTSINLSVSNSSIDLTGSEIKMAIPVIQLSASERLEAISQIVNFNSTSFNVTSDSATIAIKNTAALTAATATVTAGAIANTADTITNTAGTHNTVVTGSCKVSAPNSDLELTEEGATLTLQDDAKLTIDVGGTILEVSKTGVSISATLDKPVVIGESPNFVLVGPNPASPALSQFLKA